MKAPFWKVLLKILLGLIGVALVLLAVFVYLLWQYKAPSRRAFAAAEPPAYVTNLAAFLTWRPEPDGAFRAQHKGSNFVILLGPSGYSPRQVSGPAGYLFDSTGRFITWSPDLGDNWLPHVPGTNQWTKLRLVELQQIANAQGRP